MKIVGWLARYGATESWSSFGKLQLHKVAGSVHPLLASVLSGPTTDKTPVGMGGKSVRFTQIEGTSLGASGRVRTTARTTTRMIKAIAPPVTPKRILLFLRPSRPVRPKHPVVGMHPRPRQKPPARLATTSSFSCRRRSRSILFSGPRASCECSCGRNVPIGRSGKGIVGAPGICRGKVGVMGISVMA
jgi:hypothetical protein